MRSLLLSARSVVARGVDRAPVCTNFEMGRHVVAYEQQGERRAEYGKEVLKRLAASQLLPAIWNLIGV